MPDILKRRSLLTAGLGAAATSLVSAARAEGANPPLKWRLGSGWSKNQDILYGATETLARIVGEATDGHFEIQPGAVGEFAPADALIDAVGTGKIEMGYAQGAAALAKDPVFALCSAVPFGLNARGQSAWWLQAGASEIFSEIFAKHGLIAFPGGNTGAQMGGWFRKEVRSAADLQGLKLRITGLGAQVMQKLGVVPKSTDGPDILPQLEKRELDAAEWVGPYDDEKLNLQKAAPFYHFPGFWEGGLQAMFWINAAAWKGLPKAYRPILQAAAAQAAAEVQAKYDARNPQALRRLVSAGAQLKPFPQDVIETALKHAGDLYGELSNKSPDFKRAYESMKTFRTEEFLWFQVAEYTYDNFMIRARAGGRV